MNIYDVAIKTIIDKIDNEKVSLIDLMASIQNKIKEIENRHYSGVDSHVGVDSQSNRLIIVL